MKIQTYKYIAQDASGKNVKGTLEAPNPDMCVQMLKHKNLKLSYLTIQNNWFSKINTITLGKVLGKKQLIYFLSQLGSLLKSNINLLMAIELIALQENNKNLRRLYFSVHQKVYNGSSLGKAFRDHPRDFPTILTQMVEATVHTGNLTETINYMADYFKKQDAIAKKIRQSYLPPLMYLLAAIGVAIGLTIAVFPVVTSLFDSFPDAELPVLTVFFMKANEILMSRGLLLAGIIGFIIVLYIGLKKISSRFRAFNSYLLIRTPLFGKLSQLSNELVILNMLASMMSYSVNTLIALNTLKQVLKSQVYLDLINQTIEDVQNGVPLSKSFSESKFIDPIMARMLIIGEQTGDVAELLQNLAYYYNQSIDARTERIKQTLKPIILLLVYGLVGCLILAMMLPMMTLGTHI